MEKIRFTFIPSKFAKDDVSGDYYRASDVDAKISELEAEIERLEKYIDALHKQG